MFGLSIAEQLKSAILNAAENNIASYKDEFRNNFDQLNNSSEKEGSMIITNIRRNYLDQVADSVFSSFKISSPKIALRMQLAMLSPKMCGYDIDLENGVLAGSLYAICYFAIKDKVAPARDCIQLNHLHNVIMDRVITELDDELSIDNSR